jgi:hypothetical protein
VVVIEAVVPELLGEQDVRAVAMKNALMWCERCERSQRSAHHNSREPGAQVRHTWRKQIVMLYE